VAAKAVARLVAQARLMITNVIIVGWSFAQNATVSQIILNQKMFYRANAQKNNCAINIKPHGSPCGFFSFLKKLQKSSIQKMINLFLKISPDCFLYKQKF